MGLPHAFLSLPIFRLAVVALVASVGFACGADRESADGAQSGLAIPGSGVQGEAHPELIAGRESLAAGRLDEARQHFERVPATDASYLTAQSELATVHAALGDPELSLQMLEQITRMDTGNPDLFVNQSWILYSVGRLEEAELSALRAIELAPDAVAPRYNVALFRVAQGRLPEAIEAYRRAMLRDFAMDYVSRAREHLVQLTVTRPDFADPHYALAYFANSLGNRKDELDELERYLAMNPTGPAVEVARARLEEARQAVQP
jgi:tetratricopeptide (TPR) repeat protein